MNISWGDLNNVQEAGDYPFRGGALRITFAEIAIWKKNADAKFQLMRKHPVQGAVEYVLGKQIDERPAPAAEELFHESSNGDSWSVTHDPTTGVRAVIHRANPASGGQASHIEIEKFLSENADGPEHQALRRLLETSATNTILIAYDIHPSRGPAYDELSEAIKSLGAWWHHLEAVWIVRCGYTPYEIRDRLKPLIGFDDQLLVIDVSGDTAGWVGVNDIGSLWLNENI